MADTSPAALRRTRIDPALIPSGAILVDTQRARTRWSEGMFVTAEHFNRDQSYLVTRAGDFGRAIGAGVVEGLEVATAADDPTAVIVQPGLGIAGSGDSIVLHGPVRIPFADIALQKALAEAAGLAESLQFVAESRSGLFVLCATPVEFTSNPVASYATTPGGKRKLEDGLVNEATLFTLVPWSLAGIASTPDQRRAVAARRIFIDGKGPDIPTISLPLAMVELDGNVVVWLDAHLMRRDAGAARADVFGLGLVDTPGRIAHHRQYDAMIAAMVGASPGFGFAAADRFEVLPPMGRMPAACIAPRAPAPGLAAVLSHSWLPAEMPVELVALPEDEIDQLLEESLTLPPIDLGAGAEVLAQMPVSVIVPIPRAAWPEAPTEIVQQALSLSAARPLGRPPQTPKALIQALLERQADTDLIDPTVSAEWLALLSGRAFLWYMRRRQFLRTDALTGEAYLYQVALPPPGEEPPAEEPPVVELPTANDMAPGPIIDRMARLIERGLGPWGLAPVYRRLAPTHARETRALRVALDSALGAAIAGGSALAATDILHRFRETSTVAAMDALAEFYDALPLERDVVPQEGLLVGGVLDVMVGPFDVVDTARRITTSAVLSAAAAARIAEAAAERIEQPMARALNLGHAPEPVPDAAYRSTVAGRLAAAIQQIGLPSTSVATLLRAGHGRIGPGDPRSGDELVRFMALAADAQGLPLGFRVPDPGGIEAQTRRNLVAQTGRFADIARLIVDAPLVRVPEAVLRLHGALDAAMGAATADARRLARDGVAALAEVLGA